MNYNPALKWLVPAIMCWRSLPRCGLFPARDNPTPMTNFRGEEVTINARGLYYWDTVSSAAQMQANDLVTLGAWTAPAGDLPLADAARLPARKTASHRNSGIHPLHPISQCASARRTTKLFGLCGAAQPESVRLHPEQMSFDLKTLPSHFSEKCRAAGSPVCSSCRSLPFTAWLGRVAATFTPDAIPALENTTCMFIQAMDLGIIVPLCVLSGSCSCDAARGAT